MYVHVTQTAERFLTILYMFIVYTKLFCTNDVVTITMEMLSIGYAALCSVYIAAIVEPLFEVECERVVDMRTGTVTITCETPTPGQQITGLQYSVDGGALMSGNNTQSAEIAHVPLTTHPFS